MPIASPELMLMEMAMFAFFSRLLSRIGLSGRAKRSDWLPPKGWKPPSAKAPVASMPALVLACLGDAGKAERLVQYEMKRQPGISRAAAVAGALSRLQADRRL